MRRLRRPLPAAGERRPQRLRRMPARPPRVLRSFVPFRYAYPLDHLVRGLKFAASSPCGRVLGELFARDVLARTERTVA